LLAHVPAAALVAGDSALVKNNYALLRFVYQTAIVGCHDNRRARLVDLLKQVHDFGAGGWVEVSGWLIG
jgi:hypothetical protein